jgi:recombination protein RecA
MVEAKAFSVVVIDACALNAHALAAYAATGSAANDQSQVNLSKWPNVVRRLNMALQGTQSLVLLLTNQSAYRPLSLPVGMRLDLSCPKRGELTVQVAKEKYGRISMPRNIRSFK